MVEMIADVFTVDRAIALCLMAIIPIWGFEEIQKQFQLAKNKEAFTSEFESFFNTFVDSGGADESAYNDLLQRVNKMQQFLNSLPSTNFDSAYRPYDYTIKQTFEGYFPIANDKIFLHLISYIHDQYNEVSRSSLTPVSEVHFIKETLLKCEGEFRQERETSEAKLRQPSAWIIGGLNTLMAMPLALVRFIGILTADQAAKIASTKPAIVISRLLIVSGLIANVMTIIIGWDDFTRILFGWQ